MKSKNNRIGRPFTNRPNYTLSEDEAIQAALKITRENGLDQLSIKGLAEKLNTSRPPLYAIFKDRNGLVKRVVDSVLTEFLPSNEVKQEPWQEQIRSMGLTALDSYIKYPGVAHELIRTGFPDTHIGRNLVDHQVSMFLRAGFTIDEIPSLILAISSLISGASATISAQNNRENQLNNADGVALQKHLSRKGKTLPVKPLGVDNIIFALELMTSGMELSLKNRSD